MESVTCSIVIAARDEAGRIEETVGSLLAQRDVDFEIIVVDDRSNDGTGDIIRQIATRFQRVRLLRIDELPPGWIGKCHACHLGASAATSTWILFTDADCWLKPDVLGRALRVAQRDDAAHVTMTPGIVARTHGARAWHVAFLISLANWFSGVNRNRPGAYVGIGAFNLVRRDAYENCGGYESLRLTVLDDVRLGMLIARAGYRTRAFIAGDDVECDWGSTVRDMIRIMEKNYFAAIDFRTLPAIVLGIGGLLVWTLAVAAPFTGNPAGLAAGAAGLTLVIPAQIVARRLAWPLSVAVVTPFIYPAMFYAVLRSTWLTLRRGGVSWRETFYPLALLREAGIRHTRNFKRPADPISPAALASQPTR